MKLPIPNFLSKPTQEEDTDNNTTISPSLWPWPYYCHRPRTLSFRTAADDANHLFRTINSAYSVDAEPEHGPPPEESSPEDDTSVIEMAVRGLRSSERLFFEPGETSSILEESKRDSDFALVKEGIVMCMESQDPYVDFRKSMEEMVKAYGLKEWEGLKGLLDWYLRVNGKANHGHILGAFVDLLVNLQAQEAVSYPHHHDYSSSPISSSPPLSLCTSASASSSSNSLSTPSISMFEAEGRNGGGSPCLSHGGGVEEEFEIR